MVFLTKVTTIYILSILIMFIIFIFLQYKNRWFYIYISLLLLFLEFIILDLAYTKNLVNQVFLITFIIYMNIISIWSASIIVYNYLLNFKIVRFFCINNILILCIFISILIASIHYCGYTDYIQTYVFDTWNIIKLVIFHKNVYLFFNHLQISVFNFLYDVSAILINIYFNYIVNWIAIILSLDIFSGIKEILQSVQDFSNSSVKPVFTTCKEGIIYFYKFIISDIWIFRLFYFYVAYHIITVIILILTNKNISYYFKKINS